MARKAKTDPADDGQPEAPDRPDGAAESAAKEDDVQDRDNERDGQQAGSQAEDEHDEHEQEIGAPATEQAAADDGPAIEDLVPGLDAALGSGGIDADARIAELETEKAEQKDQLLRALAELENTRRRAERDRRDAETYGGTRLARDLLAVYDNLNRALGSADDELRAAHGAFLEGVELTRRELLSAFARHNIAKVSPEPGEKFDPHLHQAMFEAPVPGAPDGTVIEVMEDGFTIADRLLRPARVGVARGGGAAASEVGPSGDGGGEAAD